MMAVVSIVELMQSLSLLTLELRASAYNCRARWRDDFSRSVERPWPCQKPLSPCLPCQWEAQNSKGTCSTSDTHFPKRSNCF